MVRASHCVRWDAAVARPAQKHTNGISGETAEYGTATPEKSVKFWNYVTNPEKIEYNTACLFA